MANVVSSTPTVAVPADLLVIAVEALEDAGCGFWACQGETLEPIDMVTCNRCATLARLRTLTTGSNPAGGAS
jgi:hypothetical protein